MSAWSLLIRQAASASGGGRGTSLGPGGSSVGDVSGDSGLDAGTSSGAAGSGTSSDGRHSPRSTMDAGMLGLRMLSGAFVGIFTHFSL